MPQVQPWHTAALGTFCLHLVSSQDLQSQSVAAHFDVPSHENGFWSSLSPWLSVMIEQAVVS